MQLLAHRPWKIEPAHIEALVEGGLIEASAAVRQDSIPAPTSRQSRRRRMRTEIQRKIDASFVTATMVSAQAGERVSIPSEPTLSQAAELLLRENDDRQLQLSADDVARLKATLLRERAHRHIINEPAPPSDILIEPFQLSESDTWSMNELAQAIVVLTTYHAMSGLVLGMGLQPECDIAGKVARSELPFSSAPALPRSEAANSAAVTPSEVMGAATARQRRRNLREKLLTGIREEDDASSDDSSDDSDDAGVGNDGNRARRDSNTSSSQKSSSSRGDLHDAALSTDASAVASPSTRTDRQPRRSSRAGRRCDPFERAGRAPVVAHDAVANSSETLTYQRLHCLPLWYRDFSTTEGIFRTQDFSWEQHGFSLISRFYPLIAPLLDDIFDHTYNLTYNTLAGEGGVDTAMFRTAIWFYVHRLHGICNDDYDYSCVNKIVDKGTKAFVKKVRGRRQTSASNPSFISCSSWR